MVHELQSTPLKVPVPNCVDGPQRGGTAAAGGAWVQVEGICVGYREFTLGDLELDNVTRNQPNALFDSQFALR